MNTGAAEINFHLTNQREKKDGLQNLLSKAAASFACAALVLSRL
jgi:hypothetical protein